MLRGAFLMQADSAQIQRKKKGVKLLVAAMPPLKMVDGREQKNSARSALHSRRLLKKSVPKVFTQVHRSLHSHSSIKVNSL